MHVYTNDTDTVIAADLDDVRAIIEAHIGCTLEAEGWSLDDWRMLPDDEIKTIRFDDEVPPGVEPRVTKTCAEWIASEGRGFLCSTEY
jgi:hypothetical protein